MPLRVMMDWYDAAGNALQKDADLKVTIGAAVYWGNHFTNGWSSTGGAHDTTNNTEGVFLDSSSGLPASGTIQVDVIGTTTRRHELLAVVSGNVTSQAVTQVSMNKGTYNCSDTVTVTVNDTGGSSPVSVTWKVGTPSMPSSTPGPFPAPARAASSWGPSRPGPGSPWPTAGTSRPFYNTSYTTTASVNCQLTLADGGYFIKGGCDNDLAGTGSISGPPYNGYVNEFYTKYMDAGEYSSYTMGFVNQTGIALTDVYVTLSFSGAGASKMTVYNSPVYVGSVPVGGTGGGDLSDLHRPHGGRPHRGEPGLRRHLPQPGVHRRETPDPGALPPGKRYHHPHFGMQYVHRVAGHRL